nr:hypothetical protein GCM10025699_77800 [Microbacterium flavescens]
MQSAYRSYATQVSVYDGWVQQLGQAQADAQSARPEFSEHQTGLALDISPIRSAARCRPASATPRRGGGWRPKRGASGSC